MKVKNVFVRETNVLVKGKSGPVMWNLSVYFGRHDFILVGAGLLDRSILVYDLAGALSCVLGQDT